MMGDVFMKTLEEQKVVNHHEKTIDTLQTYMKQKTLHQK